MEQQLSQPAVPVLEHSHKWLYITITLSSSAAAILLVLVLLFLTKSPVLPQYHLLPYQPETATQTQQASSSLQQTQQITPIPIQNKQGLEAIAQTLDATSMSQVTTGLNQNTQDSSSFNQ